MENTLSATVLESESLKGAFETFNRHSTRLTASYEELKNEVVRLRAELGESRDAHARTVTDKERLSSRLAGTLEALPAALIFLDGDGFVIEHNGKAADMLGSPLLGAAWADIARRECVPAAGRCGELRLKDGRWLNLARQPLSGNAGDVLLLTDVSDAHRTRKMLERASRLSCVGEMTAGLVHQLRTPLASALLNVARLRGDSEQQELAARVRDRLNEVGRIINDTLRFAAGPRRSDDEFSISALIADVVETCDNGCDVVRAAPNTPGVSVAGNRDAIKGALANLVDNARQACGDDARIEVTAEVHDGSLHLSVTDNGPGIADDIRDRLFEPFFTTRPQGTGLGLAVARAVAEVHGGGIVVDSSPAGACFTLRLPLRSAGEDA